ncbi:MAG: hypothetical protein K0R78_3419 [Pelosinus sp.]|jgi:hypothetical protein|nr:hypothetical protein [Pelosinus sp.]
MSNLGFYSISKWVKHLHARDILCVIVGVTAIFALSEVMKMYPLFNFDKFIADAAHDNYPTYKLLNK